MNLQETLKARSKVLLQKHQVLLDQLSKVEAARARILREIQQLEGGAQECEWLQELVGQLEREAAVPEKGKPKFQRVEALSSTEPQEATEYNP